MNWNDLRRVQRVRSSLLCLCLCQKGFFSFLEIPFSIVRQHFLAKLYVHVVALYVADDDDNDVVVFKNVVFFL